jgi:hypothetical protein
MALPKFTGEASLYASARHYQVMHRLGEWQAIDGAVPQQAGASGGVWIDCQPCHGGNQWCKYCPPGQQCFEKQRPCVTPLPPPSPCELLKYNPCLHKCMCDPGWGDSGFTLADCECICGYAGKHCVPQ